MRASVVLFYGQYYDNLRAMGVMSSGSMRLQKYLSTAGVCSRRQAERHMQAGRVEVNGRVVRKLGSRVTPDTDEVRMDGRLVTVQEVWVYIVLNKPKGYVTSCKSSRDVTVMDLVKTPQRLFPVGRLDKQTTGLLLLTNDGRLHHRLSHPSFDHEKEYLVETVRPLADQSLQRLARGVTILGRRTRKAQINRTGPRQFRITLQEGRNRQIRRMVRHVGGEIKRLQRVRLANLVLGNLAEGQWRFLSSREREGVLKLARLDTPDTRARKHPGAKESRD